MATLRPASALRRASAIILSRWSLAALCGAALVAGGVEVSANAALAPPVQNGCGTTSAGQSSSWCALYPGNATQNAQEQGQVSLSQDGMTLIVQTQNTFDGQAPATSSACLTATPTAQVSQRLQAQQCTQLGGSWITWQGGSEAIDLAAYPGLLGSLFTVQVGANHDAANGNGDAFYNNFGVDDASSVGATN